MLLSLDDNLHVKKIKIGSFHFIADQKILQSDWIRDTETTPNQKVVVSGATFLDISIQKYPDDLPILSADIDDHGILQSDWMRGTTGHTQPNWLIPSRYIDEKRILQNLI